ncbi:hypothetical protein [Magnetospirillum sp. UT-4]|uniref:hypothetical protein n=1 Tax=Magnetospirillum sp. UT-4 TaxID=2681467 RepID=UPI001383171D|nr:hypothetical protein [Magnetospirillum sp. UT-4]CAA7621807.1 membrane hypothetical protein [Magnetospirillum sp. UT-4]
MIRRRRSRPFIAVLPSLALIGLCAAVALRALDPALAAGTPPSIVRIAVAATCAAFAVAVAVLAARPGGRRLVNVALLNLLLAGAGVEGVLRLSQTWLPHAVVALLPPDARQRLAAERGMLTTASIIGSGQLYSYIPGSRFPGQPWLVPDAQGYRNPPEALAGSPDVVLLGDSVTIAVNSPTDLATLFRQDGIPALNLGFNGYGPPHSRDALVRHVVESGRSPKVVVFTFCLCNDVTDSQAYARLRAVGGDWRDYLGSAPARDVPPPPLDRSWVATVAWNLPYVLVQATRRGDAGGEVAVALPRGTVRLPSGNLSPAVPPRPDWALALQALDDMAGRSRAAGAAFVLAYYPNGGQIYRPGITDPALASAIDDGRAAALAILAEWAAAQGVPMVDFTAAVRDANAGTMALASEGDYHPGEPAIRRMYEVLAPVVRPFVTKTK